MKKINLTVPVIVLLAFFLGSTSCSSNKKDQAKEKGETTKSKDETLSGFMLGGIYFIKGYGGINKVEQMMSSAGYTTENDLISGYKQVMEFPFESSQSSGIKQIFSSMWNIHSKEDLVKKLDELKTSDSPNKAWDYARIVNNAAMGYACGWLTKDEVLKINAELLPIARKEYKDWDEYYSAFIIGRDEWDSEDPDKESFDEVVKNLTKSKKSIYNILPLN